MGAKSLSLEQMYRVLRGLPGTISLVCPEGKNYTLTVVNPNAPANRCQETLGLSVSLSGPEGATNPETRARALTEEELETLRSGESLLLEFGEICVSLQSNPGGHLVSLDEEHDAEEAA
jgi:hypothetical protein